jgi:hypothetical protein
MREPTLRLLRHAFTTWGVVIVIVALGAVAVLWLYSIHRVVAERFKNFWRE